MAIKKTMRVKKNAFFFNNKLENIMKKKQIHAYQWGGGRGTGVIQGPGSYRVKLLATE